MGFKHNKGREVCMSMGIVGLVVVTTLPFNTVLSISDVCQNW